jgi:hypothetical protein
MTGAERMRLHRERVRRTEGPSSRHEELREAVIETVGIMDLTDTARLFMVIAELWPDMADKVTVALFSRLNTLHKATERGRIGPERALKEMAHIEKMLKVIDGMAQLSKAPQQPA